MELIQKKEWDSNFFNLNVYCTLKKNLCIPKIEKIDSIAKKNDVDLLYHFENIDSPNEDKLKLKGYKLIQNKVDFYRKIEGTNNDKVENYRDISNVEVFSGSNDTINDLYLISKQLVKISRFYNDNNIPKEKVEELYIQWVDNSVNGEFADKVFVYREKNSIVGFCSIQKNPILKEIKISLIAIKEGYKNKSIGSNLLKYCFYYYWNKGYKSCIVSTQMENLSAIRFYEKNGFIKLKSETVYHKWYERSN